MIIQLALIITLFILACVVGKLIVFGFDKKIECRTQGNHFYIYYGKRVIDVELDRDVRIPSYTRHGKNEKIVVPTVNGAGNQIELFMSRYKTSMLAEALFQFSTLSNPLPIIQFDPANCRELSEIQLKLKCFIPS